MSWNSESVTALLSPRSVPNSNVLFSIPDGPNSRSQPRSLPQTAPYQIYDANFHAYIRDVDFSIF
ncbi:hypothetical protein C1H46_045578 [Malus baccata]|uniref:Uncharacterized protein n=1 Tax=Malus baccata TaxID=106549 RepID=A0A540K3S6_MALBA|nr:hypothetical protein C1H46_045578 [Malus baccata]